MTSAATVLNIAHRGASAEAPENTFAAFDLALEQGADHIEFDVRVTGDGVAVLHHGPVLIGKAGRSLLATAGLEELMALRPDLVRLDDFIGRYRKRVGMFLEIKHEGDAEASVIDSIARLLPERNDGKIDRILTFDPDLLRRIKEDHPLLDVVQSFHMHYRPTPATIARAAEHARGVCIWRRLLDRRMIAAANGHGLEVYVFTVDKPRAMKRFVNLGIDGIITNRPSRLSELLGTA